MTANESQRNGRTSAGLETTAIVMPCFNEASRLDPDALVSFARERDGIELILVDDGSTDETAAIIEATAGRLPESIRTLALDGNHGKAEAVRRGFLDVLDRGTGLVGFWDADLATPLSDIDDFRCRMTENPELEIVMGSRVKLMGTRIERSELRHYFGRVAATAVSSILGIPVYDTQCGAKLFRGGTSLRALFAEPFLTRWAFDVEILARWLIHRGDDAEPNRAILEVPLQRWLDVPGSKLRAGDFIRAPLDIWRIRRRYRRRIRERSRR